VFGPLPLFLGKLHPGSDLKNRVSLTGVVLRFFAGVVSAAVMINLANTCGEQGTRAQAGERPMPEKTIQQVLRDHTDSLMSLPGVVGTGQGECDGQPCILVFLAENDPEVRMQIPSAIEDYPVDVRVTGKFGNFKGR